MEEAISEAKLSAQLQEESIQALKSKPITFQAVLNRGFKKPSVIAMQQGKARLMMEDMINRAERKLEEMKRKNMAATASDEEKAEVLADELYHRPGTLLSEEEIAKMYLESECVDKRRLEVSCNSIPTVNLFRQIDGTCNNIENPLQGASDTKLKRLTPPDYEDGIGQLRGLRQSRVGLDDPLNLEPFRAPNPSARSISSSIVRDVREFEEPFSHLLMQFGQFLDHDLDLSPELEVECEDCELTEQCVPIRVRENDRIFGADTPNKGNCLPFRRAIAVCDSGNERVFEPREQINALTSYIDASMVYGSNEKQGRAVRAFKNGLLKVGDRTTEGGRESLPIDDEEPEIVACPGRDPRDCFLCGDVRCNEQVSLSIMHTLWVREHNRIARELQALNPFWSDELIYQEARKIVGAIIQKIVYYDYLPIVLGRENFDIVIGEYEGYKDDVDASVPNVFATAAYRYGHSLIRPRFLRLNERFGNAQQPLRLEDMFFNPPLYFESDGVGQVARGWVSVPSRRVDEFMNIVLTRNLFQNNAFFGPIGMDLASLNLQRARDHGLATYSTWKYFCETTFPNLDFAEINDPVTELRLNRLHGSVLNSELFTTGLAEVRRDGSLIGPTFVCLFGITFQDARDGDRFYFENEGVFTEEQRNAIGQTSFSRVICDNTDTTNIQENSFIAAGDRVSCDSSSIPRLDLEAWRDRECFLPIEVPGDIQIAAFSWLENDPRFKLFTNRDTAASECLPVVCPGQSTVNVLAFAAPNFRDCKPSGPTLGTFTFFSTQFRQSDVFDTIKGCQNADKPAITFTCAANAVAASTDASDNPESTYYKGGIPEEVSAKLKEQYDQQQAASQAASYSEFSASIMNKVKNVNHQSKTVDKNDDVLSELQEILDKLS